MIKASELRIGNWITLKGYDIDGGDNKVSDPEGDVYIGVEADDLKKISDEPNAYDPIPLTPEILEASGFTVQEVKNLNRLGIWVKPYLFLGFYQGKVILYDTELRWIADCEYLHQLQNLYFTLTGEELKYRPDYHIEESGEIQNEDFDNLKPRP